MVVRFYEQEVKSGLKERRRLSAFIKEIVATHRPDISKIQLDYIFCSDAFLLEMNQTYLDHDTYTDIITFDMSPSESSLTGEIYISIDRIKENAEKFAVAYTAELHRVIFHGALHLCGFKDKTPKECQEMRRQEDACLALYLEKK